MRFSIMEIFIVFWVSASLWVLVEYLYARIQKHQGRGTGLNHMREK